MSGYGHSMHPRFTVDGPAVRQLRMARGLEMVDVAARVGIDRAYLSRVECHSLRMTARTFLALCGVLKPDNPADLLLAADGREGATKGDAHARQAHDRPGSRTGPH
ncbi:helix-turn-helix domain-containing protein [Embleya sp. NPDC020630]|uniref:helix-turn-helix domain-containing protein n=1 Tax=Embleya sp. NPDC020630 TaxID=3363979 RepID=UPI0037BC60A1